MPIVFQDSLRAFRRDMSSELSIPLKLAGIFHDRPPFSDEELKKMRTSEFRSWQNSLRYVLDAVNDAKLPGDCGILLEYRLPITSRRVDVIVTGLDASGAPNLVIIELKQWSEIGAIEDCPGLVWVQGMHKETHLHPSLQAWNYQRFMEGMLEPVYDGSISPHACAYLHNLYNGLADICEPPNDAFTENAPVFGYFDRKKIGEYLARYVSAGNGEKIAGEIVSGKPIPAPSLINMVGKLFSKQKKAGFTLIDEQELVYRKAFSVARKTILQNSKEAESGHFPGNFKRTVILITGGPGTGKSVVAMTLFADSLREFMVDRQSRNIRFVSPTASYRNAMVAMLTGTRDRMQELKTAADIRSLFCSSVSFYNEASDTETPGTFKPSQIAPDYSMLVVDEAHRLNTRTNMYKGKSMVQDIVRAAGVSVFFVDEEQSLRPVDEGSIERITDVARLYDAEVIGPLELTAQFRCQGAEGFLNWLADALEMKSAKSANECGWDKAAFVFEVVDDPREILEWVDSINSKLSPQAAFHEKGMIRGARMLAGYAWDWSPEEINRNAEEADVKVPDHNGIIALELPWNSRAKSTQWGLLDETRHQVGCVHTSQGLEFEYVGVFIGNDLRYNPITQELEADYDAFRDTAGKVNVLKDYPSKLKPSEKKALQNKEILKYIKRCYRVLLSRGIRGARVYCCDKNLSDYLKKKLLDSENLSTK